MADSCKPNTKLFYSIYWGAQSDPNCYFHNAIQLKRSSASRSVNLQTNRTKTWQFKFTRNQGFTQDPNSEEMRRQWKAADNTRTMRQTARSRPNTRQRAKESHLARHNTNTCSSETRCCWLYTNSAFNSLTKRNVLDTFSKTIHRKFWIMNCNFAVGRYLKC